MTDDLHAFLRSRRSIRQFKPDPVPVPVIEHILETASYAPSAHNKQPWRFVVITDPQVKQRLGEAITDQFRRDMIADGAPEIDITTRIERSQRRLDETPLVVVLCRDITHVKPHPDVLRQQAEASMGVQSVAMAGLQLLLAAHAEGLGGVWICWPLFTPQATRTALELLSEWEPQGMVFIGYPNEKPSLPERKPLPEIITFQTRKKTS